MTSPDAGKSQAPSRWSDSSISTAFDVAIPSHDSPTVAAHHDAEPFLSAGLRPTTVTDDSGEIPIMLQTDGSHSLVESSSLPQLPRPDQTAVPSIVRTGTTSETLFPRPLRLRSRYFAPDSSASKALKSPSSLLPLPAPTVRQNAPPKGQHSRAHSESGPRNPAPAVPPIPPPRARSEFYPSPMKPSKALRTSSSSSNPLGLSLEQPLPSPHVRSTRSRSQSASALKTPTSATHLLQPVSPLTPKASGQHRVYDHSGEPPPLPLFSTGTPGSSAPSSVKKSRLNSGLPPPPAPPHIPPTQTPSPSLPTRAPSRASIRSSKGSLLGRALRHLQQPDSHGYNVIDDIQEDAIALKDMRKSTQSSQFSQDQVAVDLSTMAGDQKLASDDSVKMRREEGLLRRTSNDDILEAKGHLTGGLGLGMSSIVTKNLVVDESAHVFVGSPTKSGWRKTDDSFGQAWKGQAAAEYEGVVIAVEEPRRFDVSNAEGRPDFGGLDSEASPIAEDASKQSYYFPPDPHMPDWRPFTMRQWYMILLIVLALSFAAVTEALCQISLKRQDESPPASLLTFQDPTQISTGDWFVWKYLPEIILVSYGVMFQATDFEVRRLEPYYQMSQPTGAKAEESLNLDYLTFWSYLIPFKAYRHRQWAVLQSSVATLIASTLVPVLFSAALNMDPDRSERTPTSWKYVRMDPVWSRLMEVALLVVAIVSILLLVQLRRKSGLLSDPKGIAGIAAMATKSHILNDFMGLEMASHRAIHKHLECRRYILHKSSLWQGEYLTRSMTDANSIPAKTENPHPIALRIYFACTFACLLIFFLVFIPIVEFDNAVNIITDRAPWFLTLLATIIKMCWTNLETAVRMIEPFYVLSRRHAPPSTLLLDYTGTIPGYMPIKAALHSHFLLATVGICSVLCEVLTVVASSFNINGKAVATGVGAGFGNGSETKASYITSFVLAMAIPVVLAAVLAAVFLRRRHAFLPRQPNTIASVLAFVAQSKMLYDFVVEDDDTSSTDGLRHGGQKGGGIKRAITMTAATLAGKSDADELDIAETTVRELERRGKQYGLGWYRGRDGHDHLGVDEEELEADYHHGQDWSKGRLGRGEISRWQEY